MKISIITINYNNAKGLEKTIQSVISQTYSNVEYIVIDGNSTDGSKEVIEKYSEKLSYWISEPDSGVYNAMNKGISQAHGDYLNFMNSGDIFVDRNVLFNLFEKNTYTEEILRGNYITDFRTHQKREFNLGDKEVTMYDLYTFAFCHQALFIHQNLFEKYGMYDENLKIVADWKHTIKSMLKGAKTKYIDIDIASYDMYGISSDEAKMNKERELVLCELLPNIVNKDYKRFIQLEHDANMSQQHYLSNFILHHKLPRFCVKVLNKIYKILNLA